MVVVVFYLFNNRIAGYSIFENSVIGNEHRKKK